MQKRNKNQFDYLAESSMMYLVTIPKPVKLLSLSNQQVSTISKKIMISILLLNIKVHIEE